MKVHPDLSPTNGGNQIDPALVLSHDRNLTETKRTVDEAAGKHRKAKQLAKTEGVDLDILKVVKTRLKHSPEDNILWLNKVLNLARTFMVPGLDRVDYQKVQKETLDEEAILAERYEIGLMHGRQGLDVEIDLMDLSTPAGQEYKRGHDQGMEDFKNLQPILMSKMDAAPTIKPNDPGLHQADADEGAGETGDDGSDEGEEPGAATDAGETAAATAKAPPEPAKRQRGRPAKADAAPKADAKAKGKPAAAKPPAAAKASSAKPPVDTPGIMPGDDEEFAPRKEAVEKPAVPFLN